jgi:amino acid transporter
MTPETQAKDQTAPVIELTAVPSSSSQENSQSQQESNVTRSYTTSQQMGSWDAFWFTVNNTIGPGIFSVTSGIFAITGSVGITLALFIVGAVLVASTLCVALEYGMAIPRSGGEKNYLERVYRKPKYLMTCVIAVLFCGLGGSAMVAIAFGSYVLLAAGRPNPAGSWETRFIAIGVVTFAAALHAFFPTIGVRFLRVFGILKLVILVFIICSGFAALAGHRLVADPHNFDNMFAVETGPGYGKKGLFGYGSAVIRTLYCYMGVMSITAVLGETKSPRRTIARVMPIALGIVTILYTLVNIAYFAAIPKAQIAKSDVIVAGIFFANVFGQSAAAKVLPALVAFSCLGTILSASFSHGRMNQEIAKEGILPWSHFWASNKPFGAPGPAVSPSTPVELKRSRLIQDTAASLLASIDYHDPRTSTRQSLHFHPRLIDLPALYPWNALRLRPALPALQEIRAMDLAIQLSATGTDRVHPPSRHPAHRRAAAYQGRKECPGLSLLHFPTRWAVHLCCRILVLGLLVQDIPSTWRIQDRSQTSDQ